MNLKLRILSRVRFASSAFSHLLARRWKRQFYLHLAFLFTLFALADSFFLHATSEISANTFDKMVLYRLSPPKPDPNIVIVDINEASLSAMSRDYGRWPWPRRVLGEFVEQVEKQQPKAVVFDILFSDADVFNPSSDTDFNASIAKTNNTFFPMLLLDASDNATRKVKLIDIPGVTPIPEETPVLDATINMILPHFKSAIEGGRLGTQNVIMDKDGVVRNYPVYLEGFGWQVPALPTRLGREFDWPPPSTDRMLLNWRGKPFSYHYLSFSEVYLDLMGKNKQPALDGFFKDKIVIIGSTAPNLYDVRTTPMAEKYPGVELLATAIDNYKHGDSLRFPDGRIWFLLMTLAIIWLTAWAFHREEGRGNLDSLFSLSQVILIGFSFASINFTDTYINLAGPVMFGIAYFSVARTYATATEKILEQNMVRIALSSTEDIHCTLLLLRFDSRRNAITSGMLGKVRQALKRVGTTPKSVEIVLGEQKGLWGLFQHTIAISWAVDASDEEAKQQINKDVALVAQALPSLLRTVLLHLDGAFEYATHEATFPGGEASEEGWRTLFAAALMILKNKQAQSNLQDGTSS